MMLKITIVLLLLAIASTFILRVLGNSLSSVEKLDAAFLHRYPTRLYVITAIMCLFYIATFVCAIITVITW